MNLMARSSERDSRGFTIVELMVVTAIIGVAVALLLPAVQSARESARQIVCKNNLKQIGIALHGYHDVHGTLPVGCLEWRGFAGATHRKQFAWSAMLLPFLEQQTLHEQIDFGVPFDHPKNQLAAAVRVATYQCPNVPDRVQVRGPIDYGGLYGETHVDRTNNDGLLVYERAFSFADCSDGLNQTFVVAEDALGPDPEWINGRNVFVVAYGINDPDAWIGDNEIRSLHPGLAMTLLLGGAVRATSETIDRSVLGGLITRAGGEVIRSDQW
jgi:prepilin-type N-terminal cleavage/methylation domain-containing protein